MPAQSKAQQRFMGMVHAAQKGEEPASPEVAKVAKTMDKSDAKDYASTKHKGLPGHVKKEAQLKEFIKRTIREDFHNSLNESKFKGNIAGDAAKYIADELSFYVKGIINQSNHKVTYLHLKDKSALGKVIKTLADIYGIKSQSGGNMYANSVVFDNNQVVENTNKSKNLNWQNENINEVVVTLPQDFIHAVLTSGYNGWQIAGIFLLDMLLTMGATGIVILTSIGLYDAAMKLKKTIEYWNASRKINKSTINQIVGEYESKLNKLKGGERKFFLGLINKLKKSDFTDKRGMVQAKKDLDYYSDWYGLNKNESVNEVVLNENDAQTINTILTVLSAAISGYAVGSGAIKQWWEQYKYNKKFAKIVDRLKNDSEVQDFVKHPNKRGWREMLSKKLASDETQYLRQLNRYNLEKEKN